MWRLIFRSFIYALLYLCDECWINSSGSKQWSFNQIFIFWKWTKSQRSKAGKQTRGEYKLCWCGQKTPVFSKHFVLARDCTLAGTSSEAPVQSISSVFSIRWYGTLQQNSGLVVSEWEMNSWCKAKQQMLPVSLIAWLSLTCTHSTASVWLWFYCNNYTYAYVFLSLFVFYLSIFQINYDLQESRLV